MTMTVFKEVYRFLVCGFQSFVDIMIVVAMYYEEGAGMEWISKTATSPLCLGYSILHCIVSNVISGRRE